MEPKTPFECSCMDGACASCVNYHYEADKKMLKEMYDAMCKEPHEKIYEMGYAQPIAITDNYGAYMKNPYFQTSLEREIEARKHMQNLYKFKEELDGDS